MRLLHVYWRCAVTLLTHAIITCLLKVFCNFAHSCDYYMFTEGVLYGSFCNAVHACMAFTWHAPHALAMHSMHLLCTPHNKTHHAAPFSDGSVYSIVVIVQTVTLIPRAACTILYTQSHFFRVQHVRYFTHSVSHSHAVCTHRRYRCQAIRTYSIGNVHTLYY